MATLADIIKRDPFVSGAGVGDKEDEEQGQEGVALASAQPMEAVVPDTSIEVEEPEIAPQGLEPVAPVAPVQAQPQFGTVTATPQVSDWDMSNAGVTVDLIGSKEAAESRHSFYTAVKDHPEVAVTAPWRVVRDTGTQVWEHLLEGYSSQAGMKASAFELGARVMKDRFIGDVAQLKANQYRIQQEQTTGLMEDSIEYREERRDELMDKLMEDDGEISFGEEVLLSASDSIASSTAALVGAYVTRGGPNAAGLIMGGMSGLNESSEQRAAESNAVERIGATLVNAAAEYGFERYSFKALMGDKAASEPVAKQLGKFLAREWATEFPTEAIQYAAEAATRNPDPSWDEFFHNMAVTAVSVPISAGGQVGIYRGTRPAIKFIGEQINGVNLYGTALDEEFQTRTTDLNLAKKELNSLQAAVQDIALAFQQERTMMELETDPVIRDRLETAKAIIAETLPDSGFVPFTGYVSDLVGKFQTVESGSTVGKVTDKNFAPGAVTVLEYKTVGEELIDPNISPRERERIVRIQNANRKGGQQIKKFLGQLNSQVDPTGQKTVPIFINILPRHWSRLEGSNGSQATISFEGDDNTTTMVHEIDLASDLFDSAGNLSKRGYDILAHEYGHSVFEGAMRSLTEDERTLLVREWEAKILKNWNKPIAEVAEEFFAPERAKQVIHSLNDWIEGEAKLDKALGVENPVKPNVTIGTVIDMAAGINNSSAYTPSDARYLLSAPEYIAEQVSQYMQADKKQVDAAGAVFQDLARTLNRYQKVLTSVRGESTSVARLFESFALKPRVELAVERAARTQKRFDEYVAELKKNPPEEMIVDRVGGLFRRAGKRTNNSLDAKKAQKGVVKWNQFLRVTQGIINISQANPHIEPLRRYRDLAIQFNTLKNEIAVGANEVVDEWLKTLSTKENATLEVLLFEADRQSSKLKRKLTAEELIKIGEDYEMEVSPKVERMAKLVWAKFGEALERMENVLLRDVRASYDMENFIEAQEANKQMAKIKREFASLRNRNYMPHSRFGRYWVWFTAPMDGFKYQGDTFKKGDTVTAMAFEHKSEMEAEQERISKEIKNATPVLMEEMSDETMMFAGMPETLLERVMSKASTMQGMDAEQIKELQRKMKELTVEMGSAQSFKKRLENRKNVKGYSTSGMRVFSEYFWRFSNHMARLEFGPKFEQTLKEFDEYKKENTGKTRFKLSQMENYLKDHRNYIMNPVNEWAGLRSVLFHWYLGFSVRAAMVNFTQVPLVLYPYLSKRYGDIDASAEMLTAFTDVGQFWKKGKQFTLEEMQVINEMTKRGILHESNASTLAAAAGEELLQGRLKRLTSNGEINRMGTLMMQKAGRASPFMFQQIEIMNRYVTLLSAFRLSRRSGRSYEESVEEVYHALHMTQYEYAKVNRPIMMRGKKGAFFTFWQYLTNTLFFVYDDPARWRYMMMLMLMGGLTSLPFAGNIMDLLNSGGTQMNKALVRMGFKSKGHMKVELERDIEEFLNEIMDNPWVENPAEFTMYGASRALSPYDLYYSVSMGRILPTEFTTQTGRNANDAIGGVLRESSAAGSLVYNAIQAMSDTKDGQMYRALERMMPTFARNLTQAYRAQTQGVERDASGYTVYEYSPDSIEDRAMIAGKAMSFTPTKIAEIKRDRFAAKNSIAFYQGFQANLFGAYWRAMVTGDEDRKKDVMDSIKAYNDSVPFPEMKIVPSQLVESMKQRMEQDQLQQRDLYGQRKYNRLYQDYTGERE